MGIESVVHRATEMAAAKASDVAMYGGSGTAFLTGLSLQDWVGALCAIAGVLIALAGYIGREGHNKRMEQIAMLKGVTITKEDV